MTADGDGVPAALAAGMSTFLVSDFADPVRVRGAAPDAFAQAARAHREIVSQAAARHRGVDLPGRGEGAAAAVAFRRPAEAVAAALEIRPAVRERECPVDFDVLARIALHTAAVSVGVARNDPGVAVRRCERLGAMASGDQIVLCRKTRELLLAERLPDGVQLRDLGVHTLPDLGRPEHVYELTDPDQGAAGELRSVETLPNNLPRELTSFIGRERELAKVHRLLDDTRLLTLTGAGGCGKSRLALQAAAEMLDRFPGGVWWVELAAIADPAMVGQALADTLEVRPLPGCSPLEAAVAHLTPLAALVLLDNCEHLLEGAAEAAEALLGGCPEVTVVTTSRAPLGLPAETTWRVPSLSLPEDASGRLEAILGSDAVQLFAERARRVRPEFAVAEASAPVLAEICSALDGIPLAIELAAARARMLSLEQVAAGLQDRFRLLTGGARSALARHRTLRASVDWSHELLSDEARTLFRRLAAFAGGFTFEACEAVCAVDAEERTRVIDVLGSLVDNSLVVVEERGPAVRYRLLETVREYALERLRAAEEIDAMRDRHRDFFLGLAERVAPELQTASAGAGLDALDADGANLNAALRRAIETHSERALRLCAALSMWWRMRGIFAAADAYCARALDADDLPPTTVRARVLWTRAYLLTYVVRNEEAAETAQEALELAEELGDAVEMAWAFEALGRARFLSDPAASRPMHERACELARASGEDFCLVMSLQTMAWAHLICTEYDEGERALEEALSVTERRGFQEPLAWHWLGMSYRQMVRADSERFFEFAERALGAARAIGDPMTEGFAHGYCGIVELAQGRAEAVVERLEASRERVLASGAGMALVLTEFVLGTAYATLGDLDAGRARIQMVVDTGADNGGQLAWAMLQLADVVRVAGDPAGAEDWARKALEVSGRVQTPQGVSWSKEVLGRVAAGRGEWREAEALLHDALAARAERGLQLWLPQTLDALAGVAAGLGAPEEATRVLGAAERARSDLGLVRWAPDRPRFEALADELRAEMGDEAFGDAWAEGRGLALEEAIAWIRRARGSRKRPPSGWESLTPTELEVARRVAAGSTNAEIGRAMFITAGTVKTHLSHIYAKLGLRNRTELTAETSRRLAANVA